MDPHYISKHVEGNKDDPECSFFFNRNQARGVVLKTLRHGFITKQDYHENDITLPTKTKKYIFSEPVGYKNNKLCYAVKCIHFSTQWRPNENDIITSYPVLD